MSERAERSAGCRLSETQESLAEYRYVYYRLSIFEVAGGNACVTSLPAALPILYIVLRLLIVLNWLFGAAILALLLVMPNEQWIMSAFKLSPGPDADRLIL